MVSRCALSVIVPCYNEEASLEELHRRTSAACRAVLRPLPVGWVTTLGRLKNRVLRSS